MSTAPKKELPKNYNATVEAGIYKNWEEKGYFAPKEERGNPFVISLPPPNATGRLHIGHAMMLAVEDLMVRYHRLQGDDTLWLPGTDHAAIATNFVVEKKVLKEEGKTRHDLGRQAFLKRVNEFVAGSQGAITEQMRHMGASVDWTRERYTLDESLSRCVRMVFKEMYDDGLIYRGDRIVNWCTRCQSTLADDEVEYREEQVPFYHFKFGPFSIGTVRPETKLGDKYVVVHPDDERYKKYHNDKKMIPWIDDDVEMTVLPDHAAEMDMGSGAMTITPQHSMIDNEIAARHALPINPNIIGLDGKLTEHAGQFAGLTAEEARKKFVALLEEKGLVERVEENYTHNLSVCYRCDTAVQPLLSKQWFIGVNIPFAVRQDTLGKWKKGDKTTLRELMAYAVNSGQTSILPERFKKTYFNWVDNLRDWCISRQIWFGHQVPVWYRDNETYAGVEPPTGDGWQQDPDTLDTWFSSGMWTFSTLLDQNIKANTLDEWRQQSPDLKRFHPTSVLETGYDIIFNWVARMVLMSTYALGEVPFKTTYLHGLVRDAKGRKMSKSLGNVLDPLDLIKKYGADPVRLSLVIGTTPGNDVKLSDEKIGGYRNFVNKLWNISRYILTTTKETNEKPTPKTLADQWILSEFTSLKQSVTTHIEQYHFSTAGEELYDFTWKKLADWYVEIAKIEGEKDAILRHILRELLLLWHPYTPFVTEHIWSELNEPTPLIVASWPAASQADEAALRNFSALQETITAIRDLRQATKTNAHIPIVVVSSDYGVLLAQHQAIVERLGRCTLTIGAEVPQNANKRVLSKIVVYTTAVTQRDEKQQAKEQAELKQYIKALEKRLGNETFRSSAPSAIVSKEEERLHEAKERLQKLT